MPGLSSSLHQPFASKDAALVSNTGAAAARFITARNLRVAPRRFKAIAAGRFPAFFRLKTVDAPVRVT